MAIIETTAPVAIRNILYLTDFSECSEAALPFATDIALGYNARIYALHALMPVFYAYTYGDAGLMVAAMEAEEERAKAAMQCRIATCRARARDNCGAWHRSLGGYLAGDQRLQD